MFGINSWLTEWVLTKETIGADSREDGVRTVVSILEGRYMISSGSCWDSSEEPVLNHS